LVLVAAGSVAVAGAALVAARSVRRRRPAGQILLRALLRGSGDVGLVVGVLLLGFSFACALLLMRTGSRAGDPAARRRGVLFGGGLGLLALAPLAAFAPLDGDLALGVALLAGAAAVFVGHQR
jgi:hypothetical protein